MVNIVFSDAVLLHPTNNRSAMTKMPNRYPFRLIILKNNLPLEFLNYLTRANLAFLLACSRFASLMIFIARRLVLILVERARRLALARSSFSFMILPLFLIVIVTIKIIHGYIKKTNLLPCIIFVILQNRIFILVLRLF